ncbi:hypothetical protein CBF35_12715 [Vagococcus salmoninarum]|uniref:RpiR family transcriptional regulator n=1 Tax=Vagococcus salmoninarum TaxID=2739 RepID=A0A429ZGD4_9ENTE|nr:hypothetical protein CBF35_12715 [Vagococcus salmoninarum]
MDCAIIEQNAFKGGVLIVDFYQHLKKNQTKLNQQESKSLAYLIENVETIREKTLKEVADNLFLSPNTLVRLAKKLEFQGYSELKTSLLLTIQGHKNVIASTPLDEQIIKTKQLLTNDSLSQITKLLDEAENVFFFSCGLSKYPCEEFNERLRIIGKVSSSYHEPHVMQQRAKNVTEKDLIFVVSLSGETKTPLDATIIAKHRQGKVVSLTSLSQNSIAKLADVALYTFDTPIYVDGMDVTSRLSFTYLFDRLFEAYINRSQ